MSWKLGKKCRNSHCLTRSFVLSIFVLLFFFHPSLLAFEPVDLTQTPLYVRQGFDPAWTTLNNFDHQWLAISGAQNGNRPVQVRRLALKGLPDRFPFSLKTYYPKTFSFAVPFSISQEEALKPGSLGLFIGSIGVNWQIFLNGHSIVREIYTNGAGDILHDRSLNNIAVELDKRFIRPGENVLLFKIIGDPTDPETGFYVGFPFFISRYDQALEKTRLPFTRVLISLYLLIGLYFLYLFKKSRQDLSYFFFGLFCVSYFFYKLSMDNKLILLFSGTSITHRTEFVALFLLFPMILGFLDTFLTKWISRFSFAYSLFAFVLIIFCFFAPPAFLHDQLRLFQASIPIAYFHILILFYNKWYKKIAGKNRFKAFFNTLEGRLFMGITICFFIGMVDVGRSIFYVTTYQLSQYVFFLITFPMGLAVVQQFTQAQKELFNSQRQIVQSKQEAIDYLKRADRLKDEFLAATSHELKTPLHGIIGITQMALEKHVTKNEPALFKGLQTALGSARRLSILIDDILDYSRLRNNDLKLLIGSVDLHSVTEVVIALLNPLADKKNIVLCNDLPVNGVYALADENRVYQIIQNLITNAVTFTPGGQIKIYAELKGDVVVTSVKDSGIGIKQDKLETVFQSFTQLDSSETRTYQGMGLGLSITKHLVEQHGGTIWVESQPGAGSTFSFSLPATQEQPDRTAHQEMLSRLLPGEEAAPDKMETNGPSGNKNTQDPSLLNNAPTILVVDDDPVNLQIVEDYLGAEYQVITFPGGNEALSYIEDNDMPDLILLDIMMPQISGLEVCQQIRYTHGFDKLPIIFLSAKNQVADLTQGFSLGANDYLSKPFSKHELLTRVGYHIDFNTQVETASRRLGALKNFCSDLKNFKGKENLVKAVHNLLTTHIHNTGALVFQDQQLFINSSKKIDATVFVAEINQLPLDGDPVISPFQVPGSRDNGWIMKLRTAYLENYSFLLYRDNAMGAFNRADKEFSQTVLQEVTSVKSNIQNFIQDELVLKKYLDLSARIEEIYFIQADRQFSRILFEGERTLIDFDWSLGDIETYFDEKKLLRVHRSFIINPKKSIQARKEKGSRDFSLLFTIPHVADIMENLDDFQGIKLSRTKEKMCKTTYPHWFQ
ncbi:MAG: response regulator [Desulfobacteraceae bacterium]|nr:response regulator [Desulfobacteraceae bacterium]